MGTIPPVSGAVGSVGIKTPQAVEQAAPASRPAAEDRVEISELAQALSTLEPEADIRIDKVMAIREAIANGTYETPDKIEATIERLLEVLRTEPDRAAVRSVG
jgi:negative regulator of flagellin synthesis FlgM